MSFSTRLKCGFRSLNCLSYMNEFVGMLIVCHIGDFVKYNENNEYVPRRMYMCIHAALNISEPLKRSMVIERKKKGSCYC